MDRHRPALGIMLMLAGCLMLTINDAISKLLTDRLGVAGIIFGKSLMVLVAVASLAPFIGAWRVFSLADWKAQFLRATLTVISTFLFIFGLTALPLSTCVMLGSASPLYIAALAPWMSRESVGVDRWGAVVVGFIGVAILVGPPTESFSYTVAYPLGAALASALRDLMTRRMAPRSTCKSMIFFSMVAMTLVAAGGTSDGLSIISRGDWILLIVAAFATLAALYLQVEGFRSRGGLDSRALQILQSSLGRAP